MKNKVDPKKLASLTHEQKLALYDKIQTKKQIAKSTRDIFAPHSGQAPVLECKKDIIVVTAGNGYGKTCLAVNRAKAAVDGYNPWTKTYTKVPCFGVVVLDNPIKVKEVWLKELGKWMNLDEVEMLKNGKPYVNELVFKNGSRITFMFHDQEDLVFESLEMDWVIYDEPPKRSIFIALSRGQRTKGSKPWTLLIGTPLSASWIRTELYEPWMQGLEPDMEFFRGSTAQNEQNLAEGYLKKFTRRLNDDEKKVRLDGEFFDLGGLALAHLWDDKTHKIIRAPVPRDWPVIIAIDPHPAKKHVAVALAINPKTNRLQVVGERAEKQLARQFAVTLLEWSREWRVVDWVVDSLGSSEYTGGEGFKSFIQVLKDCGIRARATTFLEKDDSDWIERIQSALDLPDEVDNFGQRIPQLQVQEHCSNLIKDIQNVNWLKHKHLAAGENNKEKLDITNKDYLACLKYALAASGGIIKDVNRLTSSDSGRVSLTGSGSNARSVSIRSRYFKRVSNRS